MQTSTQAPLQIPSITEYLTAQITELDAYLTNYRASLLLAANRGAGYEPSVKTELDYIECALIKQGIYKDILLGITAGYIAAPGSKSNPESSIAHGPENEGPAV